MPELYANVRGYLEILKCSSHPVNSSQPPTPAPGFGHYAHKYGQQEGHKGAGEAELGGSIRFIDVISFNYYGYLAHSCASVKANGLRGGWEEGRVGYELLLWVS